MIALTPVRLIEVDEPDDRRLQRIADALGRGDERLATDRDRYRNQMPDALPDRNARTLHVDDFSLIAHVRDISGIDYYPSRAFVRQCDGDLVAGTFSPIDGYADYLDHYLGLGKSQYVRAAPAPGAPNYAAFEALLSDDVARQRIASAAREAHDNFWIHPYMGLEAAWELGKRLAERTGRRVRVLGPPPRLTELANNKVWFGSVVEQALGPAWTLESYTGTCTRVIIEDLARVAATAPRVAIKLADSASGMGTEIVEAADVLSRSPESLEAFVADWLVGHGWQAESPPVSVEPWRTDVVGSPSIQLWIPPLDGGPPLLEGIFDQRFYPGQEQVFQGSVPSQLPHTLQRRIGAAGLLLGRLFQLLNYVGRCSFDTILCGSNFTNATIKFTECNGRWGGTSTPMSLMNRLFGDYRRQPYVAGVLHDDRLKGVGVDEFVRQLPDVLFDARTGNGWGIVLNVGCLRPVGKLDVITLGESPAMAQRRQDEFLDIVASRF